MSGSRVGLEGEQLAPKGVTRQLTVPGDEPVAQLWPESWFWPLTWTS